MKKEQMKYLIIGAVVLILLIIIFSGGKSNTKIQDNYDKNSENGEEAALAVLAAMDEAELTGPLNLEIVSPQEKKILQGQARFYHANVSGCPYNTHCICRWNFYLTQTNKEELSKVQDTDYTATGCGFTSPFEIPGTLRLEVEFISIDSSKKETVLLTDERNYNVSP